jgi:hypothetical protein
MLIIGMRAYFIRLILFSILACVLIFFSSTAMVRTHAVLPDLITNLAGIGLLFFVVSRWRQLAQGRVYSKQIKTIALHGGEVLLDEPPAPYELWIFCRTPFAQYHGQVLVINPVREQHVINLPHLTVWPRAELTDPSPIIWRSQVSDSQRICIKFQLKSTIAKAPDIESVTILAKSMKSP